MFKRIGSYFKCLKDNAKICIAFHPLWSIPYTFYTYYLSIYLQERGISDKQLGLLMVVASIASLFFSLIAPPIVDGLGRKKATLVFDLISSAAPPLVYLFTSNFTLALIAVILANSNRIMSTAYYLLMIEDASDETRVVAFNLFNIITVIAGIIIPIAGIWVNKYGVVAAERVFLIITFISMTTMIFFRNTLVKETTLGKQLQAGKKSAPGIRGYLKNSVVPYKDAMKFLAKNKIALAFVLANIFFYVYMNLGTNYSLYFVPYFYDKLGMNTTQASMLGSVYYAGMLGAMILINPIIFKKNLDKGIIKSCIVTMIGLVLLIIIPSGMYGIAIVSTAIMAVGYGMLKSGMDAALAIYTESEYRSGIYSIVNLFSSLLGMAVTLVCSMLYTAFQGWLYILCSIMVALILLSVTAVKNIDPNYENNEDVNYKSVSY